MSLLLDESPIVFQGRLASVIGLAEAIVLQTLQYYCNNRKCGKVIDGQRWIYNTYEEWRELAFPFWSPRAIAETFRILEKMGLVASEKFDKKDGMNRKYYTVTHAAKAFLTSDKFTHLEETSTWGGMRKNLPDDEEESSRSARARLIKQYTENQTENTNPPTSLPSDASTADAEVGETFVSDSRPPSNDKQIDSAVRKKSPPNKSRQPKLVDDDFIMELAILNPGIDIDAEVRKMRNWLLTHPNRQLTQAFAVNWINKAKPAKSKTPRLPNGEIDWANVLPND